MTNVLTSEREAKARRMEDAIRQPFEIDGRSISIGVSIGLQFWRKGDPTDLDLLMGKADSSMYLIGGLLSLVDLLGDILGRSFRLWLCC